MKAAGYTVNTKSCMISIDKCSELHAAVVTVNEMWAKYDAVYR